MKKTLGLVEAAVSNSSKAIELNPRYLRARLRRAEIYQDIWQLGEQAEGWMALDSLS